MLLRQSSNPTVAKKKILSGYTTSATVVPFSRSRFQVISVLVERGILDGAPAVKHSCAQSLTGAPTVPYSRSRFQGTSMLIEQGILVLPHSRTPTVDVRISFANRTTWGAAGAVFFSQIFSGPGILQSSRLFRPQLAVYSGFEPATSRSAVWYTTNSANHSRNPAPLTKYPGFWSQSGYHYAKPSGNLGLNINGTLCEGGNVLEKLGHL